MFTPFTAQLGSESPASNCRGRGALVFWCCALGIGSVTTTFVAASGPKFVAVSVYVIFVPFKIVAGPVLVTATSACATGHSTVVVTVLLVLLVLFGSCSVRSAMAKFCTVALHATDEGTLNESVTLLEAPELRVPMLQITVFPSREQPAPDPPGLKVRPVGTVSLMVTLVALTGPALLAVRL